MHRHAPVTGIVIGDVAELAIRFIRINVPDPCSNTSLRIPSARHFAMASLNFGTASLPSAGGGSLSSEARQFIDRTAGRMNNSMARTERSPDGRHRFILTIEEPDIIRIER